MAIDTVPSPAVPTPLSAAATLPALLRRAADGFPGAGVRFAGGRAGQQFQGYPQLLSMAQRVRAGLDRASSRLVPVPAQTAGEAGHIHEEAARPRLRPVAVLLDRPEDFLPVFWGCVLGGYVPCSVPAGTGDPQARAALLEHLETLLDHPLVVAAAADLAEVHRVTERAVAVESLLDELAAEGAGADDADLPVAVTPEDVALLVLTSGSTGTAKAVALSHANLLAALAAKAEIQNVTSADVFLNWISFDHVAALIECHLLPVSVGCDQVQVTPSTVLDRPLRFLDLLDEHAVTVTFTPNFLLGQINAALAAEEKPRELDLHRVRSIVSGGEAIVTPTAAAFLAALARYGLSFDVLVPAFGMTETCAGSIYNHEFPSADAGTEFAALGRPVRELSMRVVDGADRPLPAGEAGELQLRGPMVFGGYLRNAEATAAAFTGDGWFRTGDLGRIDGGRLTLVGRSKDSIIVNGVNYFSHDLETALEDLGGVRRSYVAAFPTRPPGADTEQLVIAFVPDTALGDTVPGDTVPGDTVPGDTVPGAEADIHRAVVAIRNTTIMRWGFRPSLVLPVRPADLPKTSLGKIQRSALRRRLEAGGFAEQQAALDALIARQVGGYTPPRSATERVVAGLYAEMFDLAPETLSATASFFDIGGTSLDILRLKRRIETTFDLSPAGIPVATILTAPTVRELAARLDAGLDHPTGYDPLVPLQLTGPKTPLFCVHPGVGEVLVFVNLAKYFTHERPFYALRARGFNPGETHFTDFGEMVAAYVAAIRAKQPHGPYAVAGYSYGGAVAFEIAKSLEAAGERVDFVGIFNLPPHIKYRMEQLDVTEGAVNLAFFLSLITKEQAAELGAALRPLPPDEQLRRLVELAPPGRLAELDLDLAGFTAWAALAQSLLTMGRSYEPSGTVEALTVFYAIPLVGTKEDWLANQLRRWDDFARGRNRYVDVPGEHYTLMGPQHVAHFQEVLRGELDRALGGR